MDKAKAMIERVEWLQDSTNKLYQEQKRLANKAYEAGDDCGYKQHATAKDNYFIRLMALIECVNELKTLLKELEEA